jgi:hypothetical protein
VLFDRFLPVLACRQMDGQVFGRRLTVLLGAVEQQVVYLSSLFPGCSLNFP